MTEERINEIDESRPTTTDGNLFLMSLRRGDMDWAKTEAKRMYACYHREATSRLQKVSEWRQWTEQVCLELGIDVEK